jgi:hypothetical protein
VKPGDPTFPERKEATQDRKDDKGEMNAQDKIRQYSCFHLLTSGQFVAEILPAAVYWPTAPQPIYTPT